MHQNARNNAVATTHDQRPGTALPISAMRLFFRGLRGLLSRVFYLLYYEKISLLIILRIKKM